MVLEHLQTWTTLMLHGAPAVLVAGQDPGGGPAV